MSVIYPENPESGGGSRIKPTLTDFLLARIAEDEHRAKQSWAGGHRGSRWLSEPDRQLAECKAKRRIIGLHRSWDENEWQSPPYFSAPMDEVLACLALPYADHPDFDEAWRA